MNRFVLLVCIISSPLVAGADELDYLKDMAAKEGFHYAGLTTDAPVGNNCYLFLGEKNTLLVAVPESVSTDREAWMCFRAAVVSATATWKLMDGIARKAFGGPPVDEATP